MPHITAVTTALPPHEVTQAAARMFASAFFGPHLTETARLLPVFDHAGVDRRYFSRPPEWFRAPRTFAEKNHTHLEAATALGERACRSILERCGLSPTDIDAIFVVNSTGVATPSLDAHLLHRLGMRRDARRIPLWGLGCAGGVSGLAHACQYLEGRPRERVLLLSLELCGLTFLSGDYSRANLIACALFGEGAAAVIVEGDEIEGRREGPRIEFEGAYSTHYPDSLDVMGWHVVDEGLQVVFAQRIPQIVRREAGGHFQGLLDRFGITRDDIDHYVLHPGGAKVLDAYQETLALYDDDVAFSRSVLRDFGNMSSVTVLFVLQRLLESMDPRARGRAWLSALGPGFSSESLLLRIG
ncbi:MAG: type III polyketide synthase [Candidatus Eisenbacteria bacterium]|uniref:Type III polyketide synthase n=1 Tax=Eiseniibacteriota bacterium TaxID=2212470 RepID=A0A956LYS5_UNCEI|nr:type III polyketide synthase [Candidatus Eisenbacteria bacterium]